MQASSSCCQKTISNCRRQLKQETINQRVHLRVGDVENISYPFRLKGDQVGCGDPDYEVSCVNNKTILEIFPGQYYVKNISHDDHVIRLVDVNFANGSGCSLPSGSFVSVDGLVKDFRFVALDTNRVDTQFVKCSRNINQANAYNYTAIPCLTRTNGTSYWYAIYDGGHLSYISSSSSFMLACFSGFFRV
ncbi:hypothetical protein M0R45_021804 [Rubus argutus]|uniref:Wall-associated receptor kinase galacturonan-binding domain-containing protein n=1 Tax=Rubus argutus TaxID=59490 RepID=A0AAW1XE16_RUBAR